MPTGYTLKLMEEGQTFEEYALTCARAFSACILLRDEPLDTPIPEFKPSDFYKKELAKSKAKLSKLKKMSRSERLKFGERAKQKTIAMHKKLFKRDKKENENLLKVEKKVKNWIPPTKDHEELANFMLEQIEISKHDLNFYKKEVAKIIFDNDFVFYKRALEAAKNSVLRYEEECKKELKRTEDRNRWVNDLRESLSQSTETSTSSE